MFFWLVGHYMRLFLMVANHRSNNGMFAMCRPSLFMMMMIVTIIMMIFKSTNSMGTLFINHVNRQC